MSLAGPALIMGNTVVVKPPRFGVLFFRHILEDLRDCFPAGAANVVFGDGPTVVEPLMKSGQVDLLAFIGMPAQPPDPIDSVIAMTITGPIEVPVCGH